MTNQARKALEELRGAVHMVANFLRRDGTPVRSEAATALEYAFAALAQREALTSAPKEQVELSDREVIDLLDSSGLDITGDPGEAIEIFKDGYRLGLKQRDTPKSRPSRAITFPKLNKVS